MTISCDQKDCPFQPSYRCACRRCDREDESGAFHACDLHAVSEQIREKHRAIYPSHILSFAPFSSTNSGPEADLTEKVALSEIVAWLDSNTESGRVGLHFQNTCKFLARELRSGAWRKA